MDTAAEKCAALVAVDAMVRENKVPADIHCIELYEWAVRESLPPDNYTETLGVLRLRWVKANPRNLASGIQCLRACVRSWDLVNAQQVHDLTGPPVMIPVRSKR